MKPQAAVKQTFKKFFKTTSPAFADRVAQILYEGSLIESLKGEEVEEFDFSHEGAVISHFCTGKKDSDLSEIIKNEMLTDWLIFKRNLSTDEEVKDLYIILLNVYSKLNNIV